jgi:hypothetical protein
MDQWIAARREVGDWGDIRVYDADRLEGWLERAPVVHVWISRLLGRLPEGSKDLETFWNEWSQMTSPPFTPALATAGREQAIETLLEWMTSRPELLTLRAETEKEAIAFIASAIQALPEDDRDRLFARAAILETAIAWDQATFAAAPSIAISQLPDRSTAPAAVGRGHHVLVPLARDQPTDHRTVDLAPVSREAAQTALTQMGFDEAPAHEYAELAWRGLQILQRKLAVSPALLSPVWAQSPTNRTLVPAILAGAWDESKPADRAVLAALAGADYEQQRLTFVETSDQPDAPIRRLGSRWFAVARADSWSQLSRLVEDPHIQPFHDAALRVLGERDPKYDLPAQERYAAAVHGKVLEHSHELRNGMSETLGLLAALDGVGSAMSGPHCASWVVRDLLEDTDWRLWASLTSELRLLAEASPDEYMGALERELSEEADVLSQLFKEERGVFSAEPGVGVLWGLETVAWSQDHLQRAALILSAINERVTPS